MIVIIISNNNTYNKLLIAYIKRKGKSDLRFLLKDYRNMDLKEYKCLKFYIKLDMNQCIKYITYAWWLGMISKEKDLNKLVLLGDFSQFLLRNNLQDKFKIPTLFLKDPNITYIIDKKSDFYEVYTKYKFFVKNIVYVNLQNKTPNEIFNLISEHVNPL